MLTEKRNREPLTRRACIAAIAGIVTVALPITALAIGGATPRAPMLADVVLAPNPSPAIAPTPSAAVAVIAPRKPIAAAAVAAPAAQQAPATLSVIVRDPSGAVMPGVEAVLNEVQSGLRYRMVSDGSGRFSIADLMPGRYEMALSLPGFGTVANVISVTAGASVQRTITMPLGSLEETIFVTCAPPAAAILPSPTGIIVDREAGVAYVNGERYARQSNAVAASTVRRAWTRGAFTAPAAQDQGPVGVPVRVGGQIAAPRQIRKVNPVCPRNILPSADTVVVLTARVGVDGHLNDLRDVSAAGVAAPAPEFVNAALEAVRQWEYTPTRLNNTPVEANVRITVQFSR
jgi:hypothetical protein